MIEVCMENIKEIPCANIRPFEEQPRKYFNEGAMNLLISSIRRHGQKQHIQIMPLEEENQYVVVDGERRLRACTVLGIPVRALIRDDIKDTRNHFLQSMMANVGQEGLTDLEIMRGILRIKQDFNVNNTEIGTMLGGKCRKWVERYIALSRLDPKIHAMMDPELPLRRRLIFSNALLLTALPVEEQLELASDIVRQKLKTEDARVFVKKACCVDREKSSIGWENEFQRFRGFLDMTYTNSDIYTKKQNVLRNMLKTHSSREIAGLTTTIKLAIKNLESLKETVRQIYEDQLEKTG